MKAASQNQRNRGTMSCAQAPAGPCTVPHPSGPSVSFGFPSPPRDIVAGCQPSIFPISTLMDHLRPSKDSANCKVGRVKYN